MEFRGARSARGRGLALPLAVAFATLLPLCLPDANSFAQSPTGTAGAEETPAPREVTIYIPYDKLRKTFEKEGRGVFLPYEKFQALWKAARENSVREPTKRPPVGALITEIENEALVGDSVVEVTATLKIDLLTEGWHEIPLRLSDAAVQSAQIDGKPAQLLVGKKGEQKLLVQKQGEEPKQLTLELKYAKSFTKTPGRNSVEFQTPQAPVNRWRIRVPEAGVKVNVQPLLAATEAPGESGDAEANQETVVLAFVGASPKVKIDWTPKAEGAKGMKALASVQSEQQVVVDEGTVRTRTKLNYTISRAELSQLVIEVPSDQKVIGVFDPNVRKWEVAAKETEKGAVQQIAVELFEPASKRQSVTIELEKFHEEKAEQEIQTPVVKAIGVARQQGVVVARLGAGLRGEATRRSGLMQMDVSEMPTALRALPWTFSYRYASLPFDLALRIEKVKPRISVDELVEAYLEPEKLTLDLLAIYTIENAGVFELSLDIPKGFEVRAVRGQKAPGAKAAVVDFHQVQTGEERILKVNLSRKALGRVGLFVELERRLSDPNLLSPTGDASEIPLPMPRAKANTVQRATGRLVVYGPESLRLNQGTVEGMRSVSVREALAGTASTRAGRFDTLRPVLAYAYTQGAATLTVNAERRKPQITARQLLVARIDSGVVKYDATITYDILYSGVKSLRIDLPTDLVNEVRNKTRTIREKAIEPTPEDLLPGYTAWRLSGESELLGQTVIRLSWEQPLKQLEVGASAELVVPRLIPRDVNRAWGQIIITKGESIDVRPAGEIEGLRRIDARHDLMPGAGVSDAAQALEFHDDWKLKLLATRYQLEEVKRTSIERAILRMVVTRSDQISVQSLYRMSSARQRLEIQLPIEVAEGKIQFDTEPLRINGKAVTLERGADKRTFFVPLVGLATEDPFVLELRYTQPGGAARLEYPTFPDNPAVQQVTMEVYLPDELANLGSSGPWTSENRLASLGLFDTRRVQYDANHVDVLSQLTERVKPEYNPGSILQSAKTFQTDGVRYAYTTLRPEPSADGALRLWTMNRKWLSGLVFGAVTLLGVILLRRGLGEKLCACAVLVVTLVLLGVFFPTLATQIVGGELLAALVVVFMLWLAVFAIRDLPTLCKSCLSSLQSVGGKSNAEPSGAEPSGAEPSGAEPSDVGSSEQAKAPPGEEDSESASSSNEATQEETQNDDSAVEEELSERQSDDATDEDSQVNSDENSGEDKEGESNA